ncbi:single-stranded nucleic acid binding R3H [Syncephalis plumigaleata]|nr:single-stranded nucleic acid binding R3H [Syncephalis plumigaleata]
MDAFLLTALNNPRDRIFLLKLDKDMEQFILDTSRTRLEFPPLNSYQRLIIHKVAAYFNISHSVEPNKKSVVILNKGPDSAM